MKAHISDAAACLSSSFASEASDNACEFVKSLDKKSWKKVRLF